VPEAVARAARAEALGLALQRGHVLLRPEAYLARSRKAALWTGAAALVPGLAAALAQALGLEDPDLAVEAVLALLPVAAAAAAAGLALARRGVGHHPVLALPAYFCMVQAASLHATWNLIRGVSYDRWQPERAGSHAGEPPGADRQPGAHTSDPGPDAPRDGGDSSADEARAA